jgi:hypothetical protein
MNMVSKISIQLSNDEAIVLYELIGELDQQNKLTRAADKRVLWDIQAMIEKQSDFVLSPHYKKELELARKKLSDRELEYKETNNGR